MENWGKLGTFFLSYKNLVSFFFLFAATAQKLI